MSKDKYIKQLSQLGIKNRCFYNNKIKFKYNSLMNSSINANKTSAPKSKSFVSSALVLTIGALLCKIIGAFYRVPLTNVLGLEGMGIYQMIFPIYSVLLIVSSTGVPTAISKLVSESLVTKDFMRISQIKRCSFLLLSGLGLLFSLCMMVLSKSFSNVVGNKSSYLGFLGVAPAIFIVSIISVYRGYYQGKEKMVPTVISQIIEQLVKLIAGLSLASFLSKYGIQYAVLGAICGVTISELFALLYLIVVSLYISKKEKKLDKQLKNQLQSEKIVPCLNTTSDISNYSCIKQIIKVAFPITIGSLVLPLTIMIDGFMIVNILSKFMSIEIATTLYGAQSGIVATLINLPAVISLSLSTAIVPSLCGSIKSGKKSEAVQKINIAIKLCLIISLPCFLVLLFFGPEIISILYGGSIVNNETLSATISLLKISSVSTIYISFLQIFTSILQSSGKFFIPVKNLVFAAIIKVVLNYLLISNPNFGIYGAAISSTICFMLACMLNAINLRKYFNIKLGFNSTFKILVVSILFIMSMLFGYKILSIFNSNMIAFILSAIISSIIYLILFIKLKIICGEEMSYIPKFSFKKKKYVNN